MNAHRALRTSTIALATAGLTFLPQAPVALAAPDGAQAGNLMLVMDASGSMTTQDAGGRSRIDAARDALHAVVSDLPEDQPVGMRVLGATVQGGRKDPKACTDSQRVVDLGTDNRDELDSAIDNYEPKGDTPIGYALEQAGKDLRDAEGKRTVLLVSDGLSTCDPDPCEVAADLSGKGIDAEVHTVGLNVDSRARKELECIAEKGNGQYHDVSDTQELTRAVEQVAARANRDFTAEGTKVVGTRTPEEAPPLTAGTSYLDTLPPTDGVKYYRLDRTIRNSTFHAAVTTEATGSGQSLEVSVVDSKGEECGRDFSMSGIGGDGEIVAARALTWSTYEEQVACGSEDTLYMKVGDVGDLAGEPVELLVTEEPPVRNGRELPEAQESAVWEPMKTASQGRTITPGTGFADAPRLEPGKTYEADIKLGEQAVFRVPVDWGQRLQAEATVDWPSGFGHGTNVHVETFAADRKAQNPLYTETPLDDFASEEDRVTVQAMTGTVAYRNRDLDAYAPTVAGDQYVVVTTFSMSDDDQLVAPLRLTVDTKGKKSGEPEYVTTRPARDREDSGNSTTEDAPSSTSNGGASGDASSSAPSSDSEPAAAEEDAEKAGSDAGRGPATGVLIGIGALGLLAVATGTILLLARRS